MMNKKQRLRNDILVIVGLLIIAAVSGCALLLRGGGDTVEVTINGELYGVYALSVDRTDDIRTGDGELNRLIIRDDTAYVETATCPDGICAAHRPIFRNGESIVCLPHGVVITVVTAAQDDVDIVV